MANFIQKIIQKRKIQREFMKQEILKALEKFYSDLAISSGIVDFMPCFKAVKAFNKYIKTDRDLARAYKNLLAYNKKMAAV